jgi:hypothetical protein
MVEFLKRIESFWSENDRMFSYRSIMSEGNSVPQQKCSFSILNRLFFVRHCISLTPCSLAEQLYQKSTRFIYELIQNAEDNKYTITSEPPWLSFTLHQDRIIIDSNEDGFTENNIRAICSIGESTKSCIEGYIGEKGIGFVRNIPPEQYSLIQLIHELRHCL